MALEQKKDRVFSITELDRHGVETPVKFEWDSATQSAPHAEWQFGVKLRTARTDYPGGVDPTEQVLGPSYSPFTISGHWDDKYAGESFAKDTWQAFERLVQRGNLVRIQFEDISITGLITECNFTYRTSAFIKYSFTVSPHYRVKDAIRKDSGAPKTKNTRTLAQHLAQQKAILQALEVKKEETKSWKLNRGDIGDLAAAIDSITQTLAQAESIVNKRIGILDKPVQALSRLAHQFSTIGSTCQTVVQKLIEYRSDLDMAWDTAVGALEFDAWFRGMAYQMRLLSGAAKQSSADVQAQADQEPLAVYRPQANESWYSISQRFYGTPHNWKKIAEYNNITHLQLTGDELLIIPRGDSLA
jgi:hypothetical protein